MVAVASAVLRLNPARPRQAPVRKWVTGSKKNFVTHSQGICGQRAHEPRRRVEGAPADLWHSPGMAAWDWTGSLAPWCGQGCRFANWCSLAAQRWVVLRHQDGQGVRHNRQGDWEPSQQLAIGLHVDILRLLARNRAAADLVGISQLYTRYASHHTQK